MGWGTHPDILVASDLQASEVPSVREVTIGGRCFLRIGTRLIPIDDIVTIELDRHGTDLVFISRKSEEPDTFRGSTATALKEFIYSKV